MSGKATTLKVRIHLTLIVHVMSHQRSPKRKGKIVLKLEHPELSFKRGHLRNTELKPPRAKDVPHLNQEQATFRVINLEPIQRIIYGI